VAIQRWRGPLRVLGHGANVSPYRTPGERLPAESAGDLDERVASLHVRVERLRKAFPGDVALAIVVGALGTSAASACVQHVANQARERAILERLESRTVERQTYVLAPCTKVAP